MDTRIKSGHDDKSTWEMIHRRLGGGWWGCGAPWGTCAAIRKDREKECAAPFGAPRGVFSLAPSRPRVFVHLPGRSRHSHNTASLDDLGATDERRALLRQPSWLRIPAPSITPADALW